MNVLKYIHDICKARKIEINWFVLIPGGMLFAIRTVWSEINLEPTKLVNILNQSIPYQNYVITL